MASMAPQTPIRSSPGCSDEEAGEAAVAGTAATVSADDGGVEGCPEEELGEAVDPAAFVAAAEAELIAASSARCVCRQSERY
jgi:hypothetical protein